MKVNEIFYSLQGEGFLAGIPSVFIRLAGCPLRCRWCDTKYAWPEDAGSDYSIADILQAIKQYDCKHIVITGGEPMVNSELPELVERLKIDDRHVTIETAGIAFVPDMRCDLMSISPKLSNSVPDESKLAEVHKSSSLDINVLNELIDNYVYQLKFVVDSQDDMKEIEETLDGIENVDLEKVMLMPQAATRDELLAQSPMVADLCKQAGFAFGQRLQIMLWDNKRGV